MIQRRRAGSTLPVQLPVAHRMFVVGRGTNVTLQKQKRLKLDE